MDNKAINNLIYIKSSLTNLLSKYDSFLLISTKILLKYVINLLDNMINNTYIDILDFYDRKSVLIEKLKIIKIQISKYYSLYNFDLFNFYDKNNFNIYFEYNKISNLKNIEYIDDEIITCLNLLLKTNYYKNINYKDLFEFDEKMYVLQQRKIIKNKSNKYINNEKNKKISFRKNNKVIIDIDKSFIRI
jgi:hypothetical protein